MLWHKVWRFFFFCFFIVSFKSYPDLSLLGSLFLWSDSEMLVFLLLLPVFSDLWRKRFYISIFEMPVSVKQGDKYEIKCFSIKGQMRSQPSFGSLYSAKEILQIFKIFKKFIWGSSTFYLREGLPSELISSDRYLEYVCVNWVIVRLELFHKGDVLELALALGNLCLLWFSASRHGKELMVYGFHRMESPL